MSQRANIQGREEASCWNFKVALNKEKANSGLFPICWEGKDSYFQSENQHCPTQAMALFYHLIISWLCASLCVRQQEQETILTVAKMLFLKSQQIWIEARLFLPDKNMKSGK